MGSINVQGIPPAELLARLYNAATGEWLLSAAYKPMSLEQAQKIWDDRVKHSKTGEVSFDYLGDTSLKITLGGATIDPIIYNRDNGVGLAEGIVQSIREGTAEPLPVYPRSPSKGERICQRLSSAAHRVKAAFHIGGSSHTVGM